MNTLPTEIRDQIFLNLKPKDLINTRELQSMNVQQQTQLSNILIDANNGDLEAAKYLISNGYSITFNTYNMYYDNSNDITDYLLIIYEKWLDTYDSSSGTSMWDDTIGNDESYDEDKDLFEFVRAQIYLEA